MKNKKIYIGAAALSLIFLILLSATVISFVYFFNHRTNPPQAPNDEIYIYVSDIESTTDNDTEYYRLVKEYNGQVGIFDADGNLVNTIDIYVKSLPKADRDDLREGITVRSEKELYSIMEAYTD